ncbi:MAG TPA: TonB-dependent receptor [Flavisolibacter sp.]|nr:TonB-dependent receptor [Flavisolibacter sp.]
MRKFALLRVLALFLCTLTFSFLFAQEKRITGTITDEKGAPLAGATIAGKNSKAATNTDANGQFSLTLPSNVHVVVVSYVGLQTEEINVSNRTSINLKMVPTSGAMSDVVVIGYGRAKRANLTSAQTTVSSKEIERTVNTTIEQAIQGRAAGVYITQNSGQPGGGISVVIRGISSINGVTEPLYVIDGVQLQGGGTTNSSNPLSSLNPSDIEDIQVLQGPSATAIYGSRATNGVLLITTKRGKAGEARLNYGFQYNIQTPPKHLQVMNLPQYAQMVKEYHALAGGTTPNEFLDPSLLGNGTDWQGELFNNAGMQKHQLSLSGGNNITTYYMSGEYLKQQGVALGSGFNRYSFRANIDNKPRDWVSVGANFNFSQTNETLTTSSESVISDALQLTPQIPVKNLNGEWGGGDPVNGANQYAPVNPIAIAHLRTNKMRRRNLLGGLNLGLNIVKGITFRTSFNTDINYSEGTYFNPTYAIGWAINTSATLTNTVGTSAYWNWNQLLEYNKQFGKHNLNLMASHESQESKWKNLSGSRSGFLTNDIFDLNAGAAPGTNGGGSGQWGMESFLGRVSYNYDNRYIVFGTVRRDGSSNFGSENHWGTFPSISAAWRVSQEGFFHVPAISELKLRIETGITGNQGSGGIYSPMISGPTDLGTRILPGRYPNPNIQWEETRTDNLGLNIGFLRNKISLEGDYYIKHTDNLLMDNPLPWYMGTSGIGAVNNPTVNIGTLQTKGWGVTINTSNINTKNFKWESNLNLSGFKTTIEKFYSDAAFVDRTSWWLDNWTQRSAVGQAPWLFRGYIYDGLFQSLDEINKSAVRADNNGKRLPTDPITGVWVGDVKYKDISGPNGKPDGIIDFHDETYIGNPWPKVFGGFTNSFSYKGFDLSILITGTFGQDIYNHLAKVNSKASSIYISRNLMVDAINYARVVTKNGQPAIENAGTDVPRLTSSQVANDNNYNTTSSKWVEDGSFIRLKNISLSYNLSSSLLARQKVVRGVRATIGAQNIATITGYSGFDPEVGSNVGANTNATNQAIGLDYGRYPLTPIYSFTLGVNF